MVLQYCDGLVYFQSQGVSGAVTWTDAGARSGGAWGSTHSPWTTGRPGAGKGPPSIAGAA